jgi:glycosyltransferase 2 family protein
VTGALDAVLDGFAGLDPRLVALALLLHVANHVLRSVAWRNVLVAAYPEQRLGLLPVAAAYATGVALNAVAPARGGDAAKVALARGAIPGSSLVTIGATISILALFDMVMATVLVLVVAAAGLVPIAPPSGMWPLVALGVVAAAAAAWLLLRRRARTLWARVRQGGAILRTPARYLRGVALVQAGAWACRVGVIMCLLAGFGLPASVPTAAVVMILCGASTLVPLTPGGAGTQQVLVALALSQTASAAAVVSFSVAMQAGITGVNALLGLAGAMAAFRTLRPLGALRAARAAARA